MTGAQAMTKTAPRVGLALVLLLIIVLGMWPSPARADGDPASDVLANQVLFLPAAAGISKLEGLRLASLIDAANHDALPIRVAIIASPSDLGAVTELWDRPRAYARFLGLELALTDQDGLLVVMPNGVGFYSPGHSAPATYALVRRVASGRSGPALVSAAQAAVMSVAQAARVRLPAAARMAGVGPRAPTPWRPTTDRVFGFVVLAALALAGAACLCLTRWRSASRRGKARPGRAVIARPPRSPSPHAHQLAHRPNAPPAIHSSAQRSSMRETTTSRAPQIAIADTDKASVR